jgi:hypothetical protein
MSDVEDNEDDFDLGGESDEPVIDITKPLSQQLPPQQSANDTSNWDDRVFLAPDGKEHIKDLGKDDQITNK